MLRPGKFELIDQVDDSVFDQSLVVARGPFQGRICEPQDQDFITESDCDTDEVNWFLDDDVIVRRVEPEPGEEFDQEYDVGIDALIVTFGAYLECRETYRIPIQFLRIATADDLIRRYEQISDEVIKEVWDGPPSLRNPESIPILKERSYIQGELWMREKNMLKRAGARKVFLCHASADKPTVKRICLDLGHAGHKPWLDEFEIKVGESIVAKIAEATTMADAMVLFLSKSAVKSQWVQREWYSTLSRQLSAKQITLLPAVIEECEIPSIISDVKFADFRTDYNLGLGSLMESLSNIARTTRRRKKA